MSKLMSALLLFLAAPAMAQSLTANDRAEIVANAASLIEQRYVDAAKARTIAASLRKHGRNWTTTDPEAFAEEVTEWLRRTTGDGHLGLSYSKDPIPEGAGEANFSAAEMEKWYGPQLNHGIEKIERLPGNIMLLDLRVFPPPAMAGDVFAAALSVVAQGDALIIDLRNNAGGMETSRLLMGYLLEGGQPLSGEYNRPANRHSAGVSPDWVPGRRFGSAKPVFVLTSRKTFSAAEAVAYDLQALKRATIWPSLTTGRSSMRCMPSTADCGGLMIGVESNEPNTPPFEIVKVPPRISSIESVPSLAFLPKSAMVFSISAKLIASAERMTGTTSPLGADTATDTSRKFE